MKRLLIASALLAVFVSAQAPSVPRLYVYWMLPGDIAWSWKSVTIDAPLVLTKDASGNAHLGIPACPPEDVIPVTTARATFPVKQFPASVYLNGLRQASGNDYTADATAKTITFAPQAVPGWDPKIQVANLAPSEVVVIDYKCQ